MGVFGENIIGGTPRFNYKKRGTKKTCRNCGKKVTAYFDGKKYRCSLCGSKKCY